MSKRSALPVVDAAKKRSRKVVVAIDKAIASISAELERNDGIYPRNSGRLSLAEVCRRAGVHPITIMGNVHRETTRLKVLEWLHGLGRVQGIRNVRTALTERADRAIEQYRHVASQFQAMYQVEIPRRDDEIARLRKRVALLEAENLRLAEELCLNRVVSLHVGSRRSKK